MDEPTESLDVHTEAELYAHVREIVQGKTTFSFTDSPRSTWPTGWCMWMKDKSLKAARMQSWSPKAVDTLRYGRPIWMEPLS